ncbi:sphingosine kinase 1 [Kryptolebias marmoratus]|uniref:sphingosine kinase n=1 Tax=Kryptolebias marmoratus TaxID=37003 RepID=A0A3Q3AHH5_KRYMA|nr:sphingosine kinase 1 [Kryptolebias marmoratus]
MDQRRAESELITDPGPVTLYGEFTLNNSRKVRCSVNLTERDLVVQRLTSAPVGRNKVVLSLKDCVGCRAYRGDDNKADRSAYFAAYFYPLKRRWMYSGVSRQRVEQCFRLSALQDPLANLEEAEKWARAVRERSARQQALRDGVLLHGLSRPFRILLLVNPESGKGQARTLYKNHIQRMLNEAGVIHTLIPTERQDHARELVKEADLSLWDAIVIMSGDGLLYEVINGLLERSDCEEAIQTPLGILPSGSGNALAASIHYYSGAPQMCSEDLLVSCGFLLCKGLVSRMDLVSIHLSSGPCLFSFLSMAWGFVADVDIESEKYRHLGAARFTIGTLVRLASLRVYKGKLAYLPATRDSSDLQLPPLDQPVPEDWVVVPEEDFVLMLAMYQSHLAEDLLAAPDAQLDDGVIHLFYVKAGISRSALLRLFLAMEKGAHLDTNCQHLVHAKVRALRLEPKSPEGIITVDGEVVEYGPVQAVVQRGRSRMISG